MFQGFFEGSGSMSPRVKKGRDMKRPRKPRKSADAVGILRRRHVESKPGMEAILDKEREKAEVARLVHDLRTQAGLTQKELADRVGTTPSVISRLEDADYGGHSLSMLRRIAAAVGQRVQVRFVPIKS
jgi:ribosome-binding protein aMBF1 (putative translation factor)